MKSYKTEIRPSKDQFNKIIQTIGVCRYVYNLYISINTERYKRNKHFMSANEFSKWLNNVYVKNDEYKWIKNVSSKAVKKSIVNAERAYKNFFKKKSCYPRFKKKRNQDVGFYTPKNSKTEWIVERHRIKVPTLGWVRLKEFGYIPAGEDVVSGTIHYKAGRTYVSILTKRDITISDKDTKYSEGIGIDLGIKEFAVVSNNLVFPNINKSVKVKKLEKKLKRTQRSLSKKFERSKKDESRVNYKGRNIDKNIFKLQKIYTRLCRIREGYRMSVINALVKTKPKFITIENLKVSDMLKNKYLRKYVKSQNFYEFKQRMRYMCKKYEIELRVVDTFYPSSKLCSCCGWKKKDLSLSDRTFCCSNCGNEIDRDLNAAINLMQAKEYIILM